ncbi:MAG: hypothetical protein DWH91_16905 [Planctomycetota bacterium]|nr:MAG: hypothetical protein DWH91_16905 [Planctomycetota bacterium]
MDKRSFFALLACSAFSWTSSASAADPELHVGMKSGGELITDLEYIVAKQGKQPKIFEEKIKENILPFLVGIDDQLPVGISLRFDGQDGLRKVFRVPVSKKSEFIDDNLVPAGIDVDPVRGDKTKSLYNLSGDVIDKGSMRLPKDNTYATISRREADVPADLPVPPVIFKEFLAEGQDLFFTSQSHAEEIPIRQAAFQKIKSTRLEKLKKNSNETAEAFELRQRMIVQQIDLFGELFAGTQELSMAWKTDPEAGSGTGKSHWTAMPDTAFNQWIATLVNSKSVFGGYKTPDKSVFSMRLLLPLSEMTKKNAREVYKLSPIVLKQGISEAKDLSFDEKAARIALSDAGIQALDSAIDVGILDVYHDIAPSTAGKHTFLLGFRSADVRAQIETIVTSLGKVRTGWSSQLKTGSDGEIQFHTFKPVNPPKTLLDFYGGDGTVHVAAGPAFVGFATGEGSLDRLKELAKLASTGEAQAIEHFVDIQFHSKPTLKVSDAFMSEKDFDLLKILKSTGLTSDPVLKKDDEDKDEKKSKSKSGGKSTDAMGAFRNLEWRTVALKAMTGEDDLVTFRLTHVKGAIDGTVQVQPTVFAGSGAVLAEMVKALIP